jgi:hypothetical protein
MKPATVAIAGARNDGPAARVRFALVTGFRVWLSFWGKLRWCKRYSTHGRIPVPCWPAKRRAPSRLDAGTPVPGQGPWPQPCGSGFGDGGDGIHCPLAEIRVHAPCGLPAGQKLLDPVHARPRPMACVTYSSPAAATPIQWHGASAAPSHRRITRTACTSARHHAAAQVPAPAKHGLLPSRTRCYFDT